jgi:paraquat-inducible protein B
MSRKTRPVLIGAFVVGALVLLAAAILAVAGNELFARKQLAVMHFSGSVYGLQVGAPVVFRGVRVGSVSSIDVLYEQASDSFSIPVVAELDGNVLRGLEGKITRDDAALALPALVERGLNAQLAMQSLLTGMLYIDLDLRPQRSSTLRGTHLDAVEIPTTATAIQALKDQLDEIDLGQITDDLSAIAASARALVAGPELREALLDLKALMATLSRASLRLDRRVDPLADELLRSLQTTRQTLARVDSAAQSVDAGAQRLGEASEHASALLAGDSALVLDLRRTADELGRTAASLREATSGDSVLMLRSERALQDLARASRAVANLAETLEQQPESLLRGRTEVVAP